MVLKQFNDPKLVKWTSGIAGLVQNGREETAPLKLQQK